MFLLNLSHCVKSYGHFCQILPLFMMATHQIWSCDVAQDANFEIFLFCPNSTFNIRKSHKSSSGTALYFRSYQPKTSWGWKTPPSASRVKGKRALQFEKKQISRMSEIESLDLACSHDRTLDIFSAFIKNEKIPGFLPKGGGRGRQGEHPLKQFAQLYLKKEKLAKNNRNLHNNRFCHP